MRGSPRRAAGCALLVAVLRAATAHAQGAPAEAERARAEQVFKEALSDEQAGHYEKAAAELVEARRLARKDTPQLLFHLGVCHAHLGKVVLARDELRAAVERAQGQGLDNVALTAREQLDVVQGRVAAVTLTKPVHGSLTALALDGQDVLGKLGAPLDVDPGAHVVQATYAEGPPVRLDVTVADGERRSVALPEPASSSGASPPPPAPSPAGPAPSPPAPGTASPPPAPEAPPSPGASSGPGALPWVAVGGGVALVAGGAVLWVLRGNAIGTLNGECGASHQQCPSSASGTISNGKLYDGLGVALFVAGGAALAAGGGLLLFGGRGSTTTARVAPLLDAHGGGLAVGGSLW